MYVDINFVPLEYVLSCCSHDLVLNFFFSLSTKILVSYFLSLF